MSNAVTVTSAWERLYNHKAHAWLALIVRWYLAYVFLDACIHKIQDPAAFALDVATYQILPLQLVNIMAIILPWLELFTAILLIIGFRVRAAALLICGMMVMFMIALAIALLGGLDISCGCFASGSLEESDPISWMTMLRDLFWLVLGAYVLVFDQKALGMDAWLAKRAQARQLNQPTVNA